MLITIEIQAVKNISNYNQLLTNKFKFKNLDEMINIVEVNHQI